MDYNLCDINTIKSILSRHGFTFSKALGQNFITDGEICPKMAKTLCADSETGVIEIGPGIGVLTKELCKTAGKVCAVELDRRLYPVLEETLYGYTNFELIESDILNLDLKELIKEKFSGFKSVKVCANLPYYITSPVIMKLLGEKSGIDEIVVMVQKEAAERLCAEAGARQTGAISIAVNYYGESEMLFEVGKECFMPSPKVDSAVIKIKVYKEPAFEIDDEKRFFNFVKAAFSQRRKTVINSVSATLGIEKSRLTNSLTEMNKPQNVRAENLTVKEFAELYNRVYK